MMTSNKPDTGFLSVLNMVSKLESSVSLARSDSTANIYKWISMYRRLFKRGREGGDDYLREGIISNIRFHERGARLIGNAVLPNGEFGQQESHNNYTFL